MSRLSEPAAVGAIEALNDRLGRLGSWLYPVLVAVVMANVTMRYVFARGLIEFEELQWYLNATAFFLCVAYAYRHDEHVRIGVLRDRLSARVRAWIEVLGVLFLLLPFCSIVGVYAWRYFVQSWTQREGSINPSGLPAIYAIKFLLFAALILLALQGVAAVLKNLCVLRAGERR